MFLKQVLIFLLLMNESISVPRLLLLQRDTGMIRRVLHWSAFLNHFWFRPFLQHKRKAWWSVKCHKSSPSLTRDLILENPQVSLIFSAPSRISKKNPTFWHLFLLSTTQILSHFPLFLRSVSMRLWAAQCKLCILVLVMRRTQQSLKDSGNELQRFSNSPRI